MISPSDFGARQAAIRGTKDGTRISFIDAAAGSGKTDTLVLRVLYAALLAEPLTDVRRIGLATFTVAAAGEMRARVRQVLEQVITWTQCENPHAALGEARFRRVSDLLEGNPSIINAEVLRERATTTLSHIDAAPWGTLHSLAATIIESNAHALQLPAALRLADDRDLLESNLSQITALESRVTAEDVFAHIGQTLGEEISWEQISQSQNPVTSLTLQSLLTSVSDSLVGQRGFETGVRSGYAPRMAAVHAAQEDAWTRARGLAERYFDEPVADSINSSDAHLFVITPGVVNSTVLSQAYLADRQAIGITPIASHDVVGFLARIVVGDTLARAEVQRAFAEKSVQVSKLTPESQSYICGTPLSVRNKVDARGKESPLTKKAVADSLKAIFRLVSDAFPPRETETLITGALLDMAIDVTTLSTDQRRETGTVSFDDLVDLARIVLTSAHRQHVDMDMLVIDEFQDSDPLQHAFLDAAVTLGIEVVTVGDQRQSIYGFRGATPELFTSRRETIQERTPQEIATLDVTFRHHPVLVEALNAIFGAGIGDSGVTPPTAVPFRGGERRGHDEEFFDLGVRVCIVGYEGNASAGRVAKSRELVQQIAYMREHKPDVALSEYAILTPTRTAWPEIKDALSHAGIDYVVSASDAAYDTPGVRGLLAVLRYLTERNSFNHVAAMHSLWVGASLTDVALGSLSTDPLAQLKAKDIATLAALPVLKGSADAAVMHVVDQLGCFTFVETIAQVDSSLALDLASDIRFILDEAALFTSNTDGGLKAFVRWVDAGAQTGSELNTVKSAGGGELVDAIQLCTIHSAKGLEYTYVFVSEIDSKARGGVTVLWPTRDQDEYVGVHVNAKYGIPTTLTQTQEDMKARGAIRNREVNDRLLYVALTRAKDYVCVISGEQVNATAESQEPAGPNAGVVQWWKPNNSSKEKETGPKTKISAILRERLHQLDDAGDLLWPLHLANASIRVEQCDLAESDLQSKFQPKTFKEVTPPLSPLLITPSLRILTGSRVKKGSNSPVGKLLVHGEGDDTPWELPGDETLEVKSGAEFGTIVHRCVQLLQIEEVQGVDVPEASLRIATRLCRGTDISSSSAADAAASIYNHPVMHSAGVQCEYPVLVPLAGGGEDKNGIQTGDSFIGGGIIDIVVFASDHVEIYDIKTDVIRASDVDGLALTYCNQLSLYANALEAAGSLPVTVMGLLTTSVRGLDGNAMFVPVVRNA